MLDHIVAGGLPHGITPMDNVIKECEEEASIPEDLARLSMATGRLSCLLDSKKIWAAVRSYEISSSWVVDVG